MDIITMIFTLQKRLYIKKTLESIFLVGCGGAMSSYSKFDEDFRCGSTIFIPFTEEEAKKWVMDRLDADTYITLFGKIEE